MQGCHGCVRGSPQKERHMQKKWVPLIAVLPSMVLVLGIAIYPIGYAFYLSMTNRILSNPVVRFIFLKNYWNNLTDGRFWQFTKTTAIYVIASVALELLIGFGLALLLNEKIKVRSLFRIIILIPLMIPPAIGALMWKVMLDATTGPINYLLGEIGIKGPLWLASSATALPTIIAIDVWIFTPFVTLILLSGLQSIPPTMYEAAAVDGAGTWKTFRMVTLPMLRPMIYLVLLFRIALSITSADAIFATTAGGPNIATTTLNFAAFQQLFDYGFMGYSASLGITVWIIVFVVSQFLISRTRHMWRGA
jgi:multiple sugar transport system permease protein